MWDTFLRDNKVIPPVLAVVALLIFSWVVVGSFIGGGAEDRPVSNRGEVAQTPDENPVPEVDSPNADSYAAYQSKDPFRRIFAPADSGENTTPPEETTTDPGTSGGTGDRNGGGSGGGGNREDTTNSGGTTSGPPRTDPTSAPPDSASQGQYDRGETTSQAGPGGNNGGTPSDDELFDSGGDLPPPR